ncbi:hypothetical protein CDEST_14046 [Colletotrichum destructivum]|uniref:Secreted protein n=1 Tax=Colletotrichum destructivum TaxID=34406 RepID=A0AAX4J0J2_9PEZI|nr:hypothetical protein CDEST_14046 [Colletotrichum destructivum]
MTLIFYMIHALHSLTTYTSAVEPTLDRTLQHCGLILRFLRLVLPPASVLYKRQANSPLTASTPKLHGKRSHTTYRGPKIPSALGVGLSGIFKDHERVFLGRQALGRQTSRVFTSGNRVDSLPHLNIPSGCRSAIGGKRYRIVPLAMPSGMIRLRFIAGVCLHKYTTTGGGHD